MKRSRIANSSYYVLTVSSTHALCHYLLAYLWVSLALPGWKIRGDRTCYGQPVSLSRLVAEALRSARLGHNGPCPRCAAATPCGGISPRGVQEFHWKLLPQTLDHIHVLLPTQIPREWLTDQLSAIVLFSPTYYCNPKDWRFALPWIFEAVSYGADFHVLPSPRNHREWMIAAYLLLWFLHRIYSSQTIVIVSNAECVATIWQPWQ